MGIELEGLLAEAGAELPRAVDLRRELHANPELGLALPETAATVAEALAPLGLPIRRGERSSSLVATLEGARPGPRIVLRADMDALPMPEDSGLPFASRNDGRMHACGHDAHTAMLIGAAQLLHRRRAELEGTVDLLFQAGEEGHFGARVALEEGLFDPPHEPEAAFAIHVDPRIPVGLVCSRPGPLLAAADVWSLTLTGKGGHASMPHDTRDPIPVACEIVQALQSHVARRVDAFDPVVLSTTRIEAGTTNNVIPEEARVLGTLRTFSAKARERSQAAIERIARGVAAAHELEVQVTIAEGYPVTSNDEGFTAFTAGVARELLGGRGYVEMPSPAMGAEDFSYLLERWPGTMVFLGVRPEPPAKPAPCHSNRMVLNEQGMTTGIALHAAVALRYLEHRHRGDRPRREAVAG